MTAVMSEIEGKSSKVADERGGPILGAEEAKREKKGPKARMRVVG